jgi:type II secretory pathway pseudopilin PulG
MPSRPQTPSSRRKAFTLVELAIFLVVIGVLATFVVPRFQKAVERAKVADAYAYLAAVHAAQEHCLACEGFYADDLAALDIAVPAPKFFTVGTLAAGTTASLHDSWTLTLTRVGPAAGFGSYTIVFTQEGLDTSGSTIAADLNPSH